MDGCKLFVGRVAHVFVDKEIVKDSVFCRRPYPLRVKELGMSVVL